MTGYTVHTGSSKKFADGWDRIFGGQAGGQSGGKKTGGKAKAAAQSAKRAEQKPAPSKKSAGKKKRQ